MARVLPGPAYCGCPPGLCPHALATYLPISEQCLASAATAALGYTWLCVLEAAGSQKQRPTMRSTRDTATRASTAMCHFFMALLEGVEGQGLLQAWPWAHLDSPPHRAHPKVKPQKRVPVSPPSYPENVQAVQSLDVLRLLPLLGAPGPTSATPNLPAYSWGPTPPMRTPSPAGAPRSPRFHMPSA